MPTSRSHKREYIEPERHDEMRDGVAEQARASDERTSTGQLVKGASTIPSLGGLALKGRTYLSHKISTSKLDEIYITRARMLRNALTREIAQNFGGGTCGVAASLLIKFAAQKTAAAESAFEAGDFEEHRKLSESARMDTLYAREHAAKAAERASKASGGGLARLRREINGDDT